MAEHQSTRLAMPGLALALGAAGMFGGPPPRVRDWQPEPKRHNPKAAAQRAQKQARKRQRGKA